jgi:hypothetical protein
LSLSLSSSSSSSMLLFANSVHKDVDDPWQSSFNFHLLQLQISIEQAFGILVSKRQIFAVR